MQCKPIFRILFFLFAVFCLRAPAQNQHLVDSMKQVLRVTENDTVKLNTLHLLAWQFIYSAPDSLIFYANQGLSLAEKMNFQASIAQLSMDVAVGHNIKGDYATALFYYQRCEKIYEEADSKRDLSAIHNNLGLLYEDMHNYEKALEYHFKSLNNRTNDWDRAGSYTNIGNAYSKQEKDSLAYEYYSKALTIYDSVGDRPGVAESLDNIGLILTKWNRPEEALKNHFRAIEVREGLLDDIGYGLSWHGIGLAYRQQGKFRESEEALLKALSIFKEVGNRRSISETYNELSRTYEAMKNFQKAHEYSVLYAQLKDSLMNEENTRVIAEMAARFESDRKDRELLEKDKLVLEQQAAIAEKDADERQSTIIRNALMVGITLLLALAFFIYRGYRQKQQANIIIGQKNRDITDSIRYAGRIQQAMQPPRRLLASAFPESFIVYRPRDIVSGDFYWFAERGDLFFAAACDCTGHGVPGALVSMIGLSLLNRVVNEKGITDVSDILDELHRSVITSLNDDNNDRQMKDGMDVSLLCINKKSRKAWFAGASRPLYYFDSSGIHTIRGDRYSVGGVKEMDGVPFTRHEITWEGNVAFYLTSDGFADQFGGKTGKKLMTKNFQELLSSFQNKPMPEQETALAAWFDEWKGKFEQVDDVLVIGIKA